VPPSVALPFGTFEALMGLPQNADVASAHKRRVKAAYAALDDTALASGPSCSLHIPRAAELTAARTALVNGLSPDLSLELALAEALAAVGEKPAAAPALWHSVKLVWASKWNERAVLFRRAHDVPDELLNIAVLIQVRIIAWCACWSGIKLLLNINDCRGRGHPF